MADDKGAGGSKGWEPFEIIIVVLLIAGLLSQIQGGTPSKKATTTTPKDTTTIESAEKIAQDLCGLTLARPRALEQVTTFVTLVGMTSGCNWPSTDTVALYAQVIDAYGKPVSAYTVVPSMDSGNIETYFNTTIALVDAPTSGKGFLILIPTQSTAGAAVTARIPLTFSAQ